MIVTEIIYELTRCREEIGSSLLSIERQLNELLYGKLPMSEQEKKEALQNLLFQVKKTKELL